MTLMRASQKWAFIVSISHFFVVDNQAQQAPLYNTPTYAKNVSHRHDFCSRLRAVENGDVQQKDSLKGMKISVGIMDYSIDEETGTIDTAKKELNLEMLDEVSYRAGFTWRDSFGVLDSPSGNYTWDALLDWTIETYDLFGDWLVRSADRINRRVKFPEHFYDASLIMIREEDPQDMGFSWSTLLTFLKPFKGGVWLVLGVTLIGSGLLYHLLDFIDSIAKQERMEQGCAESIFSVFYTFTGHTLQQPKTTGTRIASFSTAFFCLIVISIYTANMANFLIMNSSSLPKIETPGDAVKEEYSFCLWKSSTAEIYMQKYYPKAILVPVKNTAECYAGASNGLCDICITTVGTWETYSKREEYNPDCNLKRIGEPLEEYFGGFSLKNTADLCTSLLEDVISYHMLEMKLDGTFKEMWNIYTETRASINCDVENDEESERINLTQIAGIFITHAALMILALIFSLLRFRHKTRHQKRTVTNELVNIVKVRTTLNKAASVAFRGLNGVTRRSKSSSLSDIPSDSARFNQDERKNKVTFGTIDNFEDNRDNQSKMVDDLGHSVDKFSGIPTLNENPTANEGILRKRNTANTNGNELNVADALGDQTMFHDSGLETEMVGRRRTYEEIVTEGFRSSAQDMADLRQQVADISSTLEKWMASTNASDKQM